MPLSKNPSSYPPEYEEVLTRAYNHLIAHGGDYVLKCASSKTSHWLKSKLYGYFAALRSHDARPDLIGMADFVSMRCEESNLIIYKRSDSRDARALRDAMGLEDGFADSRQQTFVKPKSAVDKLKELRSKK